MVATAVKKADLQCAHGREGGATWEGGWANGQTDVLMEKWAD
jgi:hypothetical protein